MFFRSGRYNTHGNLRLFEQNAGRKVLGEGRYRRNYINGPCSASGRWETTRVTAMVSLGLSLPCLFFYLSTVFLPVKRTKPDGSEGMVPIKNYADADVFAVKFSEQVKAFIALFGQLEDLTDVPVWPGFSRGLVRSLYLLGGASQPAGIRVRPRFCQQQTVVQTMQQYLRRQNGFAFVQIPTLELQTPLVARKVLVLEMAGTFKQRSQRFNRWTREIRKA